MVQQGVNIFLEGLVSVEFEGATRVFNSDETATASAAAMMMIL
jgi:hypothetical protein